MRQNADNCVPLNAGLLSGGRHPPSITWRHAAAAAAAASAVQGTR